MVKFPEIKLNNDFVIEAAAFTKNTDLIVLLKIDNKVTPWVVYRVDENGSCHGGDYCSTSAVAWKSFNQRISGFKNLVLSMQSVASTWAV